MCMAPHPYFSVVPPTRCLASSSVRASGSPSSLSRVAGGREEKAVLVGAKTVRGDWPSSRAVLDEKATPRAVTRVENLREGQKD